MICELNCKKHVLRNYFVPEMFRSGGGPSSAADPVSRLSRLAAEKDFAMAIQRLSEPLIATGFELRAAHIQDSITSLLWHATP